MEHLDLDGLLQTAEAVLGVVEIRDIGLLESATARPQATVFGEDAYPTLPLKVAAMVHSIARNHALVDGNKRLALASAVAYFGLNDLQLTLTNAEAYDLIVAIATGTLNDVHEIAEQLRVRPRG